MDNIIKQTKFGKEKKKEVALTINLFLIAEKAITVTIII